MFNDFSSEAEHAIEFALLLAAKTNSKLYIWNTLVKRKNLIAKELTVGHCSEEIEVSVDGSGAVSKFDSGLTWNGGLPSQVRFIAGIDFAVGNVLSIVEEFEIGMLVMGLTPNSEGVKLIEAETIKCATKSGCPILLIPEKFEFKYFKKIVYPTDLRYSPHEILSFLNQLAESVNASILIANIALRGLPFMEDSYAVTIFKEAISKSGKRAQFYFNNVRERDVPRAIDVLINGMNNDLLVLMNNRFHFNELLGYSKPYAVPSNIRVPLLIFPT
ncbi:hypothetical protein SAMN04487890_110169 [Mucilaginibacter polytrichastri]|nr:hypothetical protein SAMN04487890_110169 [Mucilaginibacter polytrichastri]